jgi:rare lipoprotein A (peptidoglycan hydrolase)
MSLGPRSCRSCWPVLLLATLFVVALAGCGGAPKPTYFPGYPVGFVERGVASWYGPGFHGNRTANGERYDMHQLTAAHRTLPLGSIAVVRSMSTGRQVTVRINDRGPVLKSRILDLSYGAAIILSVGNQGIAKVRLDLIETPTVATNSSAISLEQLVKASQQSEVLIYSVGLLSEEERREANRFDRVVVS